METLNFIRPDLPQRSAIDDFEGEITVITCEDYNGLRREIETLKMTYRSRNFN